MKAEKNLHLSVITVLTLTTRDRPEKTITTVSVEKGGGGSRVGNLIDIGSSRLLFRYVHYIICF